VCVYVKYESREPRQGGGRVSAGGGEGRKRGRGKRMVGDGCCEAEAKADTVCVCVRVCVQAATHSLTHWGFPKGAAAAARGEVASGQPRPSHEMPPQPAAPEQQGPPAAQATQGSHAESNAQKHCPFRRHTRHVVTQSASIKCRLRTEAKLRSSLSSSLISVHGISMT
jgi:hypothetical protein